jgi:hypothetical protein
VQKRLADFGAEIAEPECRGPKALADLQRSEVNRLGPILKAAAAKYVELAPLRDQRREYGGVVAERRDKHEAVPDRILKAQAAPGVKDDAHRIEHAACGDEQ